MEEEARKSPVETGGVLVGLAEPAIVLAAGKPGENSVRNAVLFKGDVAADGECLMHARKVFGDKVHVVGYWHKHPAGMTVFSGQDLHQARESASGFGDGKPLLVIILTEESSRGRLGTYPYMLRNAQDTLRPIVHEAIDVDDPRIQEALRKAPAMPDLHQGGFWDLAEFQFFQNAVGKAWLQQDLDRVRKAGWEVTVGRAKKDGLLVATFVRAGRTLQGRFPRECPLNPPRMFSSDRREFAELRALREWSSSRSLVEVLAECVEVLTCPRCARIHLIGKEKVLWVKGKSGGSSCLWRVRTD
jgi:hypothetical protein